MPQTKPPRNAFLDFLKGVLILLVTYGHAIQYAGYREEGYWGDPVYQGIYMFHMPLFMAVSGYVAFSGIRRRALLQTAVTRFRQLIVPVIAWAVVYRLVMLAADPEATLAGFPRHLAGHIAYSLWFLWALFGATLYAAVLRSVNMDTPLPAALSVLATLLLLPGEGNLYLFKYTLPFFWLGYFAARHGTVPAWTRGRVFLAATLALFALCYALWTPETYIYLGSMKLVPENFWEIFLRYAAGAIGSAAALALLWRLHQIWQPGWMLMLGMNTLAIYILQDFTYAALQPLDHPWRDTLAFTLLAAPVLALLVSFACAGVGHVSQRFPLIAEVFFGKLRRSRQ